MSRIGSLDCQSFEDRIHQILDDRLTLTGDDLLMAHAARCAECETLLNEFDSIDDSIKLLPEDLEVVLRKSEAQKALASRNSTRFVLLASLAALIVTILSVVDGLDNNPSNGLSPVAKNAVTPQLAVASIDAKKLVSPESIRTPPAGKKSRQDSLIFNPEFSLSSLLPTFEAPTIPSWDEISQPFDSLEPVWNYSSQIPAVQPVHCSLNATINWVKRSLLKPERTPDLGVWVDPNMLAAV